MKLERIDHVALAVTDVLRSVAWYRDVLGLERLYEEAWGNYPAVLGIGGTAIALFPVSGPRPLPPPGRDALAMRHLAFRTDGKSFEAARRELIERGLQVEQQDHGIARSIYFQDPDGHQLEITTYEV